MKKLPILLVAALYVIACMQFVSAQNIFVGPKTGVGMSSFLGESGFKSTQGDKVEESSGFRLAFYGGAMLNIGLSDKFSLQPELLYSTQGGVIEIEESDIKKIEKVAYKIGYFKMPVLAKYYLIGELGSGLGLYVGPQVGFKLTQSGTVEIKENNETTLEGDFEEDELKGVDKKDGNVNLLNDLDFGVIAGIDYEFSFGLSLGVRYDVGFLTPFNTKNVSYKDNTFKNHMINLSIGYLFNLGE